ncbi:uncharacterized protein LOC131020499 [Salvia miltiorrhiza]|uniref:uncharacterized protein LOC131020499 n=1 Tax=Salvia miltiorrhiza TaxID=226208 RepID=UPI0025AC3ABB|nr:uncharacterized protein LOC131020499 [Salvia miltiorrhiza]
MSLHIGNLSAGTRIDELQRVFRRFGRCTVRVKDKYGFVVYDYPAGAEKALKTLRGTRICGQAITISWSNRQPRNLQRLPTGEKSNELPHRRYSMKEYAHRRLGSYGRRENEMNSQEADGELKTGASDLIYESTRYRPDDSKPYVRESSHTSRSDHHVKGDGRKNHLNVSRWDEQAIDPLNEIYLENNLDFDRYEPHNSDCKKELDERTDISPLVGSPSVKKIQDRRGLSYNEKSQKSCYICGEVGHKRSNCPLEPKRHASGCRGRPHPSGDTVPISSQDSDKEPSTSKSYQRLLRRGDSSTQEISPRGRGNEFKDKKRNWRDYESQDKSHIERARGPSSSSIHSDYTSSRSQSPSRSSQPSSRFKLKSVHSEKISLPSSSGSSPSRHSGYKTFKSRSKAGSMSLTSSSLPKEVNQNVSPFPNKAQENSKGSLANVVSLQQSMDVIEEETLLRRTVGSTRTRSISFSLENKCETRPANLEQEGMTKDSSGKDNNLSHSSPKDSHELLLSDGDEHIVDNLSLHSMKGMRDSQIEQHVAETESKNPSMSNASSSARMSLEEVHMVLKHYGLQHPEENRKDLSVEVYFGSARFWPWEMIYYRRLKKGPISAENYARRIAQNAEFGIIDRHVRGSSGWGELHEKSS